MRPRHLLPLLSLIGALPAQAPEHAAAPAATTPLQFVANVGQWGDEVGCCALGGATVGWVLGDGFAQRFERTVARAPGELARGDSGGAIVRTRFRGGVGKVRGAEPLASMHHFLRGRAAWSAPSFARARIDGLLPGIDLQFRATPLHELEYDVLLAPGADLDVVVADCEGARDLTLDADGSLCVHVDLGDGQTVTLRHQPPVAWQETPSGPRPLSVHFRLLGGCRYGFVAEGRDPALAAVVDPGLAWSTLLGGGSTESVNDLRWQPGSGLWLGGYSGSTDFPTTAGVFRTTGGHDGYVAKLAEDGRTLVWATYLGGNGADEVRGIAVDASGNVAAVGFTHSTDFPTVAGAVQTAYAGASPIVDLGDGFAVRLSANGSTLLGGTYLGALFDDTAEGVDFAPNGDLVVAGWTNSPNFPTTVGSFQPLLGGPVTLQTDGFVTRLAPDTRTRVYSTYLGGTLPDQLSRVRVDALGQATVIGFSVSSNYPTSVLGYRTSSAGATDIVVSRLNATGSTLQWSTYLGGQQEDLGLALDLAADGTVWIGGNTRATNFPTSPQAPQRQLQGPSDGFLAQLSANGQQLLYSTYFGGSGQDSVRAVSVGAGDPFFVGETMGGLPVTASAPQATFGGGSLDGFAAQLAAGGGALSFCTYLGGNHDDYLLAAVRASNGFAVVGGFTFASDFPVTANVLQTQLRGIEDGVVAKFDLQSSVNGFLRIGGGGGGSGDLAPGAVNDALALSLENATDRLLLPQSVRIAIGGVGDDAQELDGASLWLDDPALPGTRNQLLAGPVPFAVDDGDVTLSLAALPPLPVGSSVHLVVALHAHAALAAGSEFALAVVGAEAWQVAAEGVGGPLVAIEGGPRFVGPVLRAGAAATFSGDTDGDGQLTVSDLRRLCRQLGQPANGIDPNGDGQITLADVDDLRDVLLGRAVVQRCPAVLPRGSWATLGGWFPAGVPQVTIGSRILRTGPVTSREFTCCIDGDLPIGAQDLVVTLPSGRVFTQRVIVQ